MSERLTEQARLHAVHSVLLHPPPSLFRQLQPDCCAPASASALAQVSTRACRQQ